MDGSDGLMHEKVFIFDKSIVAAGSYNFTRSADERNDEQILIIDNPKITEQFLREYELLLIDASQP
jgi:phosphatidylserine/phosphatidylglycerophosphate/cardiolipin synthase-like enzyme